MHLGGKFERQSRALSGISILFAGLLTIFPAQAGDGDISASTTASKTSPSSQTTNSDDLASYIFVEDRITLEFMTGAMFSPSGIGPVVPVYNYQQNNVRLGWILDSPDAWGPQAGINDPLRGSFEAILEATGSYVWYSFGTYMVGATPQFAGGLRFLLDKNWTFNIEGAFQHISNANTSARNQGVNAYGGFVGFTYVFDKIWND
ncbi:MAG: hypothetical protein EBT95_05165 [Verrucomicrobia bacterium]|nr:hypothetical protein [Verrucomicrobiota bacterium]